MSPKSAPEIMREQIAHFFNHYKDLEPGKWTHIGKWVGVEESKRLIMDAIDRAAASAH